MKRVARWAWTASAWTLIVVAAAVSAVRVALPRLGEYRAEIEQRVSEYVGQSVAIEHIEAGWRGWTPEIRLRGIELREPSTGRAITRFAEASVAIDALGTLRARRLTPARLTVSGVRVSLARSADGALRIEGVNPRDTDEPGARQNALADWLQHQANLTVESATITWRDEQAMLAPVVFSDVWLQIRNDGDRHQLFGAARLPVEVGKRFHFLLDARGDLLTTRWSGDFYIEGRGIDPARVLNYRRWLGLDFASGEVGFRLWSRWESARLQSIDGLLDAKGVTLGLHQSPAPDSRLTLAGASASLRVRHDAAGRWAVALEKLVVNTRNGEWPASSIELTVVPGQTSQVPSLVGRAGYLRLDDIMPLVPNIAALPETLRAPLAQLAPRGEVRDLRVGYFPARPADQRFYLQAAFDGIEVRPYAGAPGVTGLRAKLKADAAGGRLDVDAPALTLTLPGTTEASSYAFQRVGGELRWARFGEAWRVVADRIAISHPALGVTVSGDVEWTPGAAPVARLLADIGNGDLEQLPSLLPHGVLPGPGDAWIRRAIQGGRITGGSAVLRGALDRFPFDEQDGVFELRVNVSDGMIEFHERWPRIEEMDGEIVYEQRRLTIDAPGGRMLGVNLRDVVATIPDVTRKGRIVEARGRALTSAAAGLALVQASPLAGKLGPRLASLNLRGDLVLDLDLRIPLKKEEKKDWSGKVHLAGNSVQLVNPPLEFDAIEGELEFVDAHWAAPKLRAVYLGEPVWLDLEGGIAQDPVRERYRMHGVGGRELLRKRFEATAPGLADWLAERSLLDAVDGSTEWRAEMTVDAEGARRLRVDSTLAGVAIALPAPLAKDAASEVPIRVEATVGDPDEPLTLVYGDRVHAEVRLARTPAGGLQISDAAIALGGGPPGASRPAGLWLEGSTPAIDYNRWRETLFPPGVTARPYSERPPTRFDVRTGALDALGLALGEVRAHGHEDADGWHLAFDGERIAGTLEVPRDPAATVRAELARLHVERGTGRDETRPPPDPARLPPMELHCTALRYGRADLGTADIRTVPTPDGMRLENIVFSSADAIVTATGDWTASDGAHRSHFEIDARGDDLATLLGRFGYDTAAIEGGRTRFGIDANWTGSPAEFKLAGLQGRLELSVRDGRLLDVDPSAGRLFGLLSIQTLPRRLMLDFADIFAKGFAFDSIEGDFDLAQGNAYTNNLVMDGPAARVEVSGRTGLADQDYDQVVTVLPQVSSSLPLASAVFGPAGVGVGAVLFLGQKMFKGLPQLDSVLSRQYTVTGRWDDPVIERVKGLDLSFGG